MEKLEIYDPAMCCSTGVCGPVVDPELIRMSLLVNNLRKKGIQVARYNLASEPQAFAENEFVSQLLQEQGPEALPIIIIDGQVKKQHTYPTNEELEAWTGIQADELTQKTKIRLQLKQK
ncbi:arsenite efflux transporter metallochaperone ArsD [Paenibacillus rhizophilus]|uniref:Arsenical resistance operon transcriptional repressor ArsD n=1 Tax=Paenibacillus rhizophilus TaxID=1850366 RepID=A0A3N9PBB8_9BACL|nr:arsenite efflux transporter metallochaperone ArsD [Paenibacillus rhizophilus]RQW13541.1 arsenical resistance operon transcriptional repressor ArsD [Paenibacillus rhizophilus]